MVKKHLILIFVLITGSLYSQTSDLVLRGFIQNDTIFLKCAPVNKSVFESLLQNDIVLHLSNSKNETKNITKNRFQSPFLKIDSLKSINILPSPLQTIIYSFKTNKLTKEKSDQLFGMLLLGSTYDLSIAKELNLFFKFKVGEFDKFQISIPGTTFTSNAISVKDCKINLKELKIDDLALVNKKPTIKWNAEELKSDFSAYNIERSENNQDFIKLNKTPFLFIKSQFESDKKNITFTDSSAQPEMEYSYRLQGISPFFSRTIQSKSENIFVTPEYKFELTIDTIISSGDSTIIIPDFSKLTKKNIENTNFLIYKTSKSPNGHFQIIESIRFLGRKDITIKIKNVTNRNYHLFELVSKYNDTISSLPYYHFMNDHNPPSRPENLKAVVNKSGVVVLDWNSNTESDILGYKLYRSNSLQEEFIEPFNFIIKQNKINDTINIINLDSLLYYRVAAIDTNYNHSQLSEIVKLKKPDIVAPVCAVIHDISQQKNSIKIKLDLPVSSDIKSMAVNKFENGSKVSFLSQFKSEIIDSLLIPGYNYEYEILVIDKSENFCKINSPKIQFEPGYREKMKGIKITVDQLKKEIFISFQHPNEKIKSYQIYRSRNKEPITLIKTIQGNFNSFSDHALSINNKYTYQISYVTISGIHSILSDPITVNY